jgi:hypothetical protein
MLFLEIIFNQLWLCILSITKQQLDVMVGVESAIKEQVPFTLPIAVGATWSSRAGKSSKTYLWQWCELVAGPMDILIIETHNRNLTRFGTSSCRRMLVTILLGHLALIKVVQRGIQVTVFNELRRSARWDTHVSFPAPSSILKSKCAFHCEL